MYLLLLDGPVADAGTIPQTVPVASSIAIVGRRRQAWRLEEPLRDTDHRRLAPAFGAFSVDSTVDPASPSHSWAPDVAYLAWGADVGF